MHYECLINSMSSKSLSSAGSLRQIRLKTNSDEQYKIDVPPDATVGKLRELVYSASKVPVVRQRLIYKGKMLTDDTAELSKYKIKNGDFIHMWPRESFAVVSDNVYLNDSPDQVMASRVNYDPNVLPPELLNQFLREERRLARLLDERPPDNPRDLELAVRRGASEELFRWRVSAKFSVTMLLFYFIIGFTGSLSKILDPNHNSESNEVSDTVVLSFSWLLAFQNAFSCVVSYQLLKHVLLLKYEETARGHKLLVICMVLNMVLDAGWDVDWENRKFALVFDQVLRCTFFIFCCYSLWHFQIHLLSYRNRTRPNDVGNNDIEIGNRATALSVVPLNVDNPNPNEIPLGSIVEETESSTTIENDGNDLPLVTASPVALNTV